MAEIKREVKTYQVDYVCDECGGEMLFTNKTHMTAPLQYEYKCKNGHTKDLDEKYPKLVKEFA